MTIDDVVGLVSEAANQGASPLRTEPSVLALGPTGTPGFVAALLRQRGLPVEVVQPLSAAEWASVQLDRRYGVVIVDSSTAPPPEQRVAQLHCAVQHIVPGGLVVTDTHVDLDRFDLAVVGVANGEGAAVVLSRRTTRVTVHDLVVAARSRIERVSAADLARRLGADLPPYVIDTRTHTDRARFGVIPGSMHIPRTVLEWHLDPANGYRHAAGPSFDDEIVVVCNGGYSSSLAAANLADIGFRRVADLIGGHHAWRSAGLPVAAPDHSHLDL